MPTYAYACTECDHRFDVHQAFTDAALTQCPECSGRLRKVFGSVGVVFKGPGFYRTDSRETGKAGKARTPTAASKDTGAGTSSSTTKEPATAAAGTSTGSSGSAGSSSGSATGSAGSSSTSGSSSGSSSTTSAG